MGPTAILPGSERRPGFFYRVSSSNCKKMPSFSKLLVEKERKESGRNDNDFFLQRMALDARNPAAGKRNFSCRGKNR